MPLQESDSYPGTPDSATVGTSGSAAARLRPVCASTRSLPPLICGTAPGAFSNIIDTRPAMTSGSAGPLPLYGTCSRSTPAMP